MMSKLFTPLILVILHLHPLSSVCMLYDFQFGYIYIYIYMFKNIFHKSIPERRTNK